MVQLYMLHFTSGPLIIKTVVLTKYFPRKVWMWGEVRGNLIFFFKYLAFFCYYIIHSAFGLALPAVLLGSGRG